MGVAPSISDRALFRESGLGSAKTGPLDEDHLQQLGFAHKRAKGVRKTARFASMSGWTTLLFGALALPFSLGGGAGLPLAISLVAIGYHEVALRKRLLRLDYSACTSLALNQVFLCLVIIAYAIWMLFSQATGEGFISSAIASNPSLAGEASMDGILDQARQLERLATYGIYGGLIAGALLFQGSAAGYYLARKRTVARFMGETPGWIIELHQRGLMG